MINFSITQKSENWKDLVQYENIAKLVCAQVEKHFEVENTDVSIVLANDEFVHELNKSYRGFDKPTNVLSFPADNEFNHEEHENLGDIIISYETTDMEAKDQGKSFENHFTHLLLHGLLHLMGLDHMNGGEAEKMEQLERQILKDLGIDDPYEGTELIG